MSARDAYRIDGRELRRNLQHAIGYLDHAPCGFFSCDALGRLVYVNVTLANWLDYDLAEIGSGELKLSDIVSGDGASLLTTIAPAPGEVKTEVFDVDLRMRGGKTLPVRLYHKLAFGADGAPGASRTLVISRARDEHSADQQRAAEVRFMRFFDHTPMAIATVDVGGAIVRINARFAKLTQSYLPNVTAGKSILEILNPQGRAALAAAIARAAETSSSDETADEDGMPCNSAADGAAGRNNSGPNSGTFDRRLFKAKAGTTIPAS